MYSTWFGTEIQGQRIKTRKGITYTFTSWSCPGPSFYLKHFFFLIILISEATNKMPAVDSFTFLNPKDQWRKQSYTGERNRVLNTDCAHYFVLMELMWLI